MRGWRIVAGLGVVLGGAACAGDPAGPSEEFGMLLLEAVSPVDTVKGTATATLTFRLKNRGTTEIELHSNDACRVKAYIRDLGSGQLVHSPQACAQAVTKLSVQGGGELVETRVVVKGTGGEGKIGLPKGKYELFAMVVAREVTLRSRPDTLVVAE